jgi:FkbM family methyltransferase
VIAIEPQAKLGKLIRQSLSANGYQDFAVVMQTAVGAETQEAELAKSDHMSGSASLAGLGRQQDSSERVTVRPLPDIVSEVQSELGRDATPTVMKIDVEGFEEQVWIGARDTFAACDSLVICLEFSPQRYRELGSSPGAFMHRIREDGFGVARLERHVRNTSAAGQCAGKGPV